MVDDIAKAPVRGDASPTAAGKTAGFDEAALQRLAAHLQALGMGQETLRIQRLTGGLSNPTFRLAYGKHRLVLRTRPAGGPTLDAQTIAREHRVMAALAVTVVPVPEMVHHCDDASIIGTPFFLMDHVDGRVFTDPSLPGLAPAARTALYREVARVLAALHDVDPDALGLSDFGRRDNYFGVQIAHWTQQYRGNVGTPVAAMEALIKWLPGNVPDDGRTRIIHGDYSIENLIFHPTEARVLAIVDWEFSTLGHPYADLAHHALAWHVAAQSGPGLAGRDLDALGIPTEDAFVNTYLTHRQADPIVHWDAYLAYSFFCKAARLQAAAGAAAPQQMAVASAQVASLAEMGWRHARAFDRTPLFRTGLGR